jgi:hypothetical protein
MLKSQFLLFLLLTISAGANSQSDTVKSMINETMLHPADAFTAYTYKKNEFGYNQALTPYPSWAWWGITDWLTTELDLEAWIGGVPSFNFRFRLLQQKKVIPGIAFETMFQYLSKERDQFHNLDYLYIGRKGASWYNKINMSWKAGEKFHFHLSGGATYAQYLSFGTDSIQATDSGFFSKKFHPDASFGVDWRHSSWGSLHSTFSYGSTFLYADNLPRKIQFSFAARFAPFIWTKIGFLNSFRIELAYLYNKYPDTDVTFNGPIGFAYWQWDWSKENREKMKKKRLERKKIKDQNTQ